MTHLLIALLLFFAPDDAVRKIADIQWRKHYRVAVSRNLAYLVTEIHDLGEKGTFARQLVIDPSGERFIVTDAFEVDSKLAVHEIADIRRKRFVRFSYPLPTATGKTLSEVLHDWNENPELSKSADTIITVETPAASIAGTEAQWKDRELSRAWISEIRTTLDPVFLDQLDLMREEFFNELTGLTMALNLDMVRHGRAREAQPESKVEPLPPDCDFDRSFGYACTESQKKFIEKKAEEGTPVEMYH